MTLKDLMASHVSGVFLNTDHFADTFTHTNPSVVGDPESVTGVLEEHAPSAPVNGAEGDRTVRTGTLYIPATVTVSVADQKQSRFVRGDETWYAKAVAIEGDMQLVRVTAGKMNHFRGGTTAGVQA